MIVHLAYLPGEKENTFSRGEREHLFTAEGSLEYPMDLGSEPDRELEKEPLEELEDSDPLLPVPKFSADSAQLSREELAPDPELLSSDLDDISAKEKPKVCLPLPISFSQSDSTITEAPTPEDIRNASYRARAGPYCLHETFQRYWSFDPITYLQCENKNCGEFARFLYECTADTAEYSYYIPIVPERTIEVLPDWVQKGIAKGHYLSSQVERLLDQKMKVLETSAVLREQVPPTHRALPGGRGLHGDEEAIKHRDYREVMQHLSAQTLKFSTLEPCRAMFCTMCRPHTSENTWGSIAKIVNEPYEKPLNTPANIYRPVIDARKLRGLPKDPTHWRHTRWFRTWWERYHSPNRNNLTPILDVILGLGLPFACIQTIQAWVVWQKMTSWEYDTYVQWIKDLTRERFLEYINRIGDPYNLPFQAEEIANSYLSPGTRPVALSMHPIWEEVEVEDPTSGESLLVEVPNYGYAACDRYLGRRSNDLREVMKEYNQTRSEFISEQQDEDYLTTSAVDGCQLDLDAELGTVLTSTEKMMSDTWEVYEGKDPSTTDECLW